MADTRGIVGIDRGDVDRPVEEDALVEKIQPSDITDAIIEHTAEKLQLLAKLLLVDQRKWLKNKRRRPVAIRSEEHTSELQSLMRNSYAVFCLKKKKIRKRKINHDH